MDHQFILLLVAIMAGTVVCTVYYVTPSIDRTCQDNPCITLTQFAAYSSFYIDTTTTTLLLEPGNHTLDVDLLIGNVSLFTIVSFSPSISVVVMCSELARTDFINIAQIHIRGVKFVGCGRNQYVLVDRFIVENSTFMDNPDSGASSGTALKLTLTAATIIQCSFINLTGTLYDVSTSDTPDYVSLGGAIVSYQSNLIIIRCIFEGNSATVGGAINAATGCDITILNSTFTNNQAVCQKEKCTDENRFVGGHGGAILLLDCNLSIQYTIFDSHYASTFGGVIQALNSNITILGTTFINNSVPVNQRGGVISANQSILNFTNNVFNQNWAGYGGVMFTSWSVIFVINNTFTDNNGMNTGGVSFSNQDYIYIVKSQFINNFANELGGVVAALESSITAAASLFANSTSQTAGVIVLDSGNISFIQNTFSHNYAIIAAVMHILTSNVTSDDDVFMFNVGEESVINGQFSKLDIYNTFIGYNRAVNGTALRMYQVTYFSYGIVNIVNNSASGVVLYLDSTQAFLSGETILQGNIALAYVMRISDSNVVVNGIFHVSKCNASQVTILAIVLSRVIFNGISIMANNKARNGGASMIVESRVLLYGRMIIINNTATLDGGGLFLHKSQLICKEKCTLIVHRNKAGLNGGGIHAWSSLIAISLSAPSGNNETMLLQSSSINIDKNQAALGGGGISLSNTIIYIVNNGLRQFNGIINFTENFAACYGGAVYIDDYANALGCGSTKNPAIEIISYYHCSLIIVDSEMTDPGRTYIHFSKNYAKLAGSALFGGLFDRCLIRCYHELDTSDIEQTGVLFLMTVTDIASLDSISSHPVRICFCRENQPDCSYEHPPVVIMKGYPFTLSLVAVDQVNNTVNFTKIITLINFGLGSIGIGQYEQKTEEACTDLKFNVFSPNRSTELTLFPSGPCENSLPSVRIVKIEFLPCSCPIGFQPTYIDETKCDCDCDPGLPFEIDTCDPHHETLVRDGNFWIAYVNSSENSSSGYIGYAHCPLDYCFQGSSKVNITLSKPDMQCAFNRSGLLCGGCKPHYSVSLGSSHCIQCSSNQLKWLMPVIILAAFIGGLLLVALLLFLNLTVAKGTLNGIIFYANVAYANNSTFFQFPRPNFISVIIAWLNLEIGLDTCFYDGMDTYWKTWFQLAFSVYLLFLIVMIIFISERSTILSNVLRRKNPVATLATLVLLSYTKLLHIIISALSSAVIRYPDGSKKVLWLPDATLEYWSGKHIALFVTALAILLVGILFTAVLFSWQWLLHYSHWRLLCWVKNQKLCMFIETYHAPYNFRHRYWTGLLLTVRTVLSVVTAVNVSGDPAINLIANCVLLVMVIVLKMYAQGKRSIYKSILIDVLESACIINLLTFSFFKLFFLAENSSQIFIAYLSGSIIIAKFVLVLAYHIWSEILTKTKIWLAIKNCRETRKDDSDELRNLLEATSDEEDEAFEPTFSIIERPKPQKPLSDLVKERSENEETDSNNH